jgi:DNA-binding XRE family transcriptional regulator
MATGSELKEARELAGLTQEEIAAALGVHRVTVVSWEGKAEVKPSKAKRFRDALAQLQKRAA